ncbi:hypothetical protein TNIN_249841 [Trichonephila inaurata madagascariensis]|uniref:Uncharacterized protein n=1 Tax=Trichonephila inaurata madagascariensis TaxID=2747483 RepID=A0A8X6YGL6_9ARAC|nr:hypothetical protein TNIN_249841 [Trichonephila inaurata madagascariensis]
MNLKVVLCTIIATIFLSCCLHEAEGSGKLGLLKLVKAGLILKALTHKKFIPIPIPIPIPIGIHKESHGHDYGHHDYGHHDYGHQGYHHDFHGHHDYHEPHHGHLVHSSGWYIKSIGKW